jgi:hypothetical protein
MCLSGNNNNKILHGYIYNINMFINNIPAVSIYNNTHTRHPNVPPRHINVCNERNEVGFFSSQVSLTNASTM